MSTNDLERLWNKIESYLAVVQERIDAAALSGESKDLRYVPKLLYLMDDEDSQVRYFALQSLVLDLQQTDSSMQDLCWSLLRFDSDEDVRRMAAACLGKIFFGTRSNQIFRRLLAELEDPGQPPAVKGAVHRALFQIAGRPPLEWPSLLGPRKVFEEADIDWEKIAWLEDQMNKI